MVYKTLNLIEAYNFLASQLNVSDRNVLKPMN